MAKIKSADIRNIVLCGHHGSGKTILAEAMLLKGKAITRLGSIADGTTVSDHDQAEKERKSSLVCEAMHATCAGHEINIIDTPGAMDFVGGMISGLHGADLAVICVNAMKGVEVCSRKAWDMAGNLGLPRVVVLTRMDGDNVNYSERLAAVQQVFGAKCVPFVVPDGESHSFKGVTAVLAPDASGDEVEALKMQITETAVACDDALMEKYLENGAVSPEEAQGAMQKAVAQGALVPVFAVSAEKDLGVDVLLQSLAEWGVSPLTAKRVALKGEEEVEYVAAEDGPLCAQVFKIVSDPHVGKLSYLRVFSGRLEAKGTYYISTSGKTERFGQLQHAQGGKREDVPDAVAGEIVVVTKVDSLAVGDTICDKHQEVVLKKPIYPRPMTGLAIAPKTRGDEQKMGTNLHRLCEEDPTFLFERNDLTGEQVVRGMGQLHLDVVLHQLKLRYGLEVSTKPPRIPYLESITGHNEGSYRHKKQTGGSGQFAEVHLRVRPAERGTGFNFVDAIVGGVISGPFIQSTESGVKKARATGPVAGYPLVDVEVELFYGKEHPVDSKDIAFQIAGEMGFREIVSGCKPVLLEPIVNMEIVFPGQYFGDISGDISSRRGRPTGTDQLGDMQVLKAQAPLAEVADYGSSLNAITQGEGFFSMELSHYEPVPGNIAQQVAARAKAAAEEEK